MTDNTNSDSSPRLIVIGYAQHDINFYPDGRQSFCIGGGGYFASLAASRVIRDVALVTRVGEDFDCRVLRTHLTCRAVSVVAGEKTATSVQTYSDLSDLTKRTITLESGVNPGISANDVPEPWRQSARIILSSTMFPQQQREIVEKIVEWKTATTTRICGTDISLPLLAVDSDQCWLLQEESTSVVRDMLRVADIVFMNRTEGEILRDMIPAIPLVVLKRDVEGAELIVRGVRQAVIPAPMTSVVDVTGAGDVLAGTFLAALVAHGDPTLALRTAVEAASRSITKHGIQHML